jgi:hypothetical protein
MNDEKFKAEIKLLRDFADLLEGAYGSLLLMNIGAPLSAYDQEFFEDMAKILNQSAGPLAGKEAELRSYYKNRFGKGRNVIYQNKIADVAVDYGGEVGKAVQFKSSYWSIYRSVSGMG